jgi:hypothetical protein
MYREAEPIELAAGALGEAHHDRESGGSAESCGLYCHERTPFI